MAPKNLPVSVALFGIGGVGSSVYSLLSAPALAQKFKIVALVNSTLSLVDPAGISSIPEGTTPSDFLKSHTSAKKLDLPALIGALSFIKGETILVDNTSSTPLSNLYPTILRSGLHIATPNKKAWSSDFQLWTDIQAAAEEKDTLCYGESTVGAGLPIITTLKDLVETGDDIIKIEGVFSGTLSYIFNQYSPAIPVTDKPSFSSIIKIAKELGYTEPDPRDDLSGTDVARKLTILSRHVPTFPPLPLGFASVPTKSLVPDVLAGYESKEDYMENLAKGDEYFDSLRADAEKEGKVLRFVGVIDVVKGEISASLQKYPATHPFATSLSGSDNIVSFSTRRYGARPVIVIGAGAGGEVTAMGVVADCLRIYDRKAEKAPHGTKAERQF